MQTCCQTILQPISVFIQVEGMLFMPRNPKCLAHAKRRCFLHGTSWCLQSSRASLQQSNDAMSFQRLRCFLGMTAEIICGSRRLRRHLVRLPLHLIDHLVLYETEYIPSQLVLKNQAETFDSQRSGRSLRLHPVLYANRLVILKRLVDSENSRTFYPPTEQRYKIPISTRSQSEEGRH